MTGANRRAPAIAWLALNPVEREDYRKIGCLEAEVAAPGIVRRLIWRVKAGDRSRVVDAVGGDFAAVSIEHVLAGAREGDGVSISVMRWLVIFRRKNICATPSYSFNAVNAAAPPVPGSST